MIIGVPKETYPGNARGARSDGHSTLTKAGFEVIVKAMLACRRVTRIARHRKGAQIVGDRAVFPVREGGHRDPGSLLRVE